MSHKAGQKIGTGKNVVEVQTDLTPAFSVHSIYSDADTVSWTALFRLLESNDSCTLATSELPSAARADAVAPAVRNGNTEEI